MDIALALKGPVKMAFSWLARQGRGTTTWMQVYASCFRKPSIQLPPPHSTRQTLTHGNYPALELCLGTLHENDFKKRNLTIFNCCGEGILSFYFPEEAEA